MQDSLLAPRPTWLPAALAMIGRLRFLTARQIAAVVDVSAKEVAGVLDALVLEQLLVRLHPTRMLDGPEPEPAFALTRRGAALIASSSGSAPAVANTKKSMFMLAHELAVNDLAVVLEVLHARHRLRLLRWETAREKIGARATIEERGGFRRVPLVADALAVVEIAGKVNAFLIEIDRGTVSVARMKAKFAGYVSWTRNGGPLERLGMKSLRVLTLAPSRARLARLCATAIEASGGQGTGLHWFGMQDDVRVDEPARMLGAVWQVARHDATTRSLFDAISSTEADEPAQAHDADRSGVPADPA